MRKAEEGRVGMDGSKEPTATEVELNHMASHQITNDPIPRAAITTLLPILCFRKRREFAVIVLILDGKLFLKLEKSKALAMRADFGGIRERETGRKKKPRE